jgi:pyruvate-ferredoxin/flavodoxin oxidoreductase
VEPDTVWDHLPREVQSELLAKQARLFVIDAYHVAARRASASASTPSCRPASSRSPGVAARGGDCPHQARHREDVRQARSRDRRAEQPAVDGALAQLHAVALPPSLTATRTRPPIVAPEAPDFVQRMTAVMLAGRGDALPVSAFPVDGTWPTATARWEKRNLAAEIPVWDTALCIQCNQCVLICPHAAIRAKTYDPQCLDTAPAGFRSAPYRAPELKGSAYTIQVAPEDCTGCQLCVEICPAKDKAQPRRKALEMMAQAPRREQERAYYDYFLDCRRSTGRRCRASMRRSASSWSRCSNTRARAPAAARRRTSSS